MKDTVKYNILNILEKYKNDNMFYLSLYEFVKTIKFIKSRYFYYNNSRFNILFYNTDDCNLILYKMICKLCQNNIIRREILYHINIKQNIEIVLEKNTKNSIKHYYSITEAFRGKVCITNFDIHKIDINNILTNNSLDGISCHKLIKYNKNTKIKTINIDSKRFSSFDFFICNEMFNNENFYKNNKKFIYKYFGLICRKFINIYNVENVNYYYRICKHKTVFKYILNKYLDNDLTYHLVIEEECDCLTINSLLKIFDRLSFEQKVKISKKIKER
jgi:hypothetical protein